MADRKVAERWVVNRLLSLVDPSLLDRIVPGERPDFTVKHRVPSLGIEVRELHWGRDAAGRPLRASEGLEEKITEKAAQLWRERGLPCVHVNLHWNDNYPPVTRRADQIASRLVDAVAARVSTIPIDGPALSVDHSGLAGDPLPDEIYSALVGRYTVLSTAFWATSRAGWIRECDPETVEAALRDKDGLVPAYREHVEELWLALGITESGPSSFVEIPPATIGLEYSSSFDRVFLVEVAKGGVHELALRGRKRGA